MDAASDAHLLRRYADEGDETAFAELVQRQLGLVYHAALRQTHGDAHAAEEVAQTVFTLVARKARTLAQHQTLAGWLHTTTRLAALRNRRTEGRRLRREHEAHLMHENFATAPASADWERLRPLIDDVLDELNAPDRTAVLLRFFSGLSLAEVGSRLNLSENAARMRVDRALDKLQALLARRGIASSATALGATLAHQAMAATPASLCASVTTAALSGAALTTGGAALAGGFFAMKTSTVILSAIAVVAIGSALFEFTAAQRAETALATVRGEHAALRTQFDALQAQRAVPLAPRDPAPGPSVATAAPRAAAPAAAEEPPSAPIMAKIQKRTADRAQTLGSRYGAFYRRLGLTAEQSAQFQAIALDNIRLNEELTKTALEQDPRMPPSMQRLIDERTHAELLTRVRETFGDAATQALQHYEDTLPLRTPVEELAKALFYTDTPLTAAQAEQLLDAAAEIGRNPQGRIVLDPFVQADFYRALLAQSGNILSPAQIPALQQLLTQNSPSGPVPPKGRTGTASAPASGANTTRP